MKIIINNFCVENKLKIISIKKSKDFLEINKIGKKFYSKNLILMSLKTPEKYLDEKKFFFRIGYTVSKNISKLAVKRNLVKRRLREAVRKNLNLFLASNDYVIIARKLILDSDLNVISKDLEFCLKRIYN